MEETKVKNKRLERKEETRKRILEVAKELFLKHGYDEVSIRKIADKLAISPTTIYLYYKDKGDVIYALHQDGFKSLAMQFDVLRNVDEPFERLKAMGRIYIKFALENPDFYELMFIMKEPIDFVNRSCASEWEEGGAAFGALVSTVTDCQSKGYFSGIEVHAMALYIWSTIHGICSLKLQGHLDHVVKAHLPDGDNSYALDAAFNTLISVIKGIK
jgi:AcrR family transcriptional regulator